MTASTGPGRDGSADVAADDVLADGHFVTGEPGRSHFHA
jgi:hypothetical protein